jgi:hypothetical protein
LPTTEKEEIESEAWKCQTKILFDTLEVGVVGRKFEGSGSLRLGFIPQKIV